MNVAPKSAKGTYRVKEREMEICLAGSLFLQRWRMGQKIGAKVHAILASKNAWASDAQIRLTDWFHAWRGFEKTNQRIKENRAKVHFDLYYDLIFTPEL